MSEYLWVQVMHQNSIFCLLNVGVKTKLSSILGQKICRCCLSFGPPGYATVHSGEML